MVFEGVLVGVLNHFLRPYVKNLDPSQLKVAIWSGELDGQQIQLYTSIHLQSVDFLPVI